MLDSYVGAVSDIFVQCNHKVFWSRGRGGASGWNFSLVVLEDPSPSVLQQLSLVSQLDPSQLVRVAGQQLFFWANDVQDPSLPVALWVTDGTDAGTRRLRAFRDVQSRAAVWQDSIFFITGGGAPPFELWRSNGTVEGTVFISSLPGYGSQVLVAGADRIFFTVTDSVHGEELWFSDGTAAGTNMVREIVPGAAIGVFALQGIVNRRLLFAPNEPTFGREPWISDGTSAGTQLLKDLFPGPTSSYPAPLAAFDDAILLVARDPAAPYLLRELWITDGTSPGTSLIKSLDESSLRRGENDDAVIAGSYAVFALTDISHGEELWVTDGTAANTRMVLDLDPGPASGSPVRFTLAGAGPEPLLYFSSYFRSNIPSSLWALPLSALLAPTTTHMSADQGSPWLTRITAAVNSPNGTPSGTVRFSGLPGDPSANLAGGAGVLLVQLPPGNYVTRGLYQGDSKFAGSESPEVTFAVPDYGVASLSATQLAFAPQLVGTDSATQNLVLRNSGTAPFAVTGINVSGTFRTTHDCSAPLSPSQSCTMRVVFTPSAIGATTGTLSIQTDHSPPVPAITLSGSGGDFSLNASGATSATVAAGQTAVFEIAVASIAGLANTIQLSCIVQPSSGSCSVSPAIVAVQGNDISRATVTVATAGALRSAAHNTGALRGTWALFAFGACLPALARRGRRLFLLMILMLAGCGGEPRHSGTASGSYTVVISGSIGPVTRSTTVNVLVR
jgi:ELWxxDGT repeat protein